MKKLYYLLLASTVAVLLASCGNNGNSGKGGGDDDGLRPKQEAISGPLREYFKVVDRAYTIREVQFGLGSKYQIIIEIERIKKGLPEPWNESFGTKVGREPGLVDVDFSVEFYDKNGDVCFKNESWYVDDYVKELQGLVDLAVGETGSLSYYVEDDTPVRFKVSSSFECHPKEELSNAQYDEPYEEVIDDNDIPQSMWTRRLYSGSLSGGGKTYNISLSISYPGKGKPGCPIIASYQYAGHSDRIELGGDWIELKELYQMNPLLYSDEYFERFDLEMNGEDFFSSTILKGKWSQYANEKEYRFAGIPKKQLKVVLLVDEDDPSIKDELSAIGAAADAKATEAGADAAVEALKEALSR